MFVLGMKGTFIGKGTQEQAIIGGSYDNCICPFACNDCRCNEDMAEEKFEAGMNSGVDAFDAEVLNSNAWSL